MPSNRDSKLEIISNKIATRAGVGLSRYGNVVVVMTACVMTVAFCPNTRGRVDVFMFPTLTMMLLKPNNIEGFATCYF